MQFTKTEYDFGFTDTTKGGFSTQALCFPLILTIAGSVRKEQKI